MSLQNSPKKTVMNDSSGEPRRKSLRLADQMEILSSTTELSSFISNASQPRNFKRKREKPKFIFSVEKDSSKTSQQEQEAYSLRSSPVKQTPQRTSPRKQSTGSSIRRLRSSQVEQTAPRTPLQKQPKSTNDMMPSPVKQITPRTSPRKQLKSVDSPRSFPVKQITPRSSPRTQPKSVQKQQNFSFTKSVSVLSTPQRTTLVSSNVTTPSRILTSTPRSVQPIALNGMLLFNGSSIYLFLILEFMASSCKELIIFR